MRWAEVVQAILSRSLAEKGRRLVARGMQDQGVGSGGDTFCSVSNLQSVHSLKKKRQRTGRA